MPSKQRTSVLGAAGLYRGMMSASPNSLEDECTLEGVWGRRCAGGGRGDSKEVRAEPVVCAWLWRPRAGGRVSLTGDIMVRGSAGGRKRGS